MARKNVNSNSTEAGFTRIEFLIVIALTGTLVAFLILGFGDGAEKSDEKAEKAHTLGDNAQTETAAWNANQATTSTPTTDELGFSEFKFNSLGQVVEREIDIDDIAIVVEGDSNCWEGCSATLFDIVDILNEGVGYKPSGIDPQGFWFQFVGPVSGQLCWVPTSLFDIQLNGESIEASEIPEGHIDSQNCPINPTFTPTPRTGGAPDNGGDREGDTGDDTGGSGPAPAACSSYTSGRACADAGCTWSSRNNSCSD